MCARRPGPISRPFAWVAFAHPSRVRSGDLRPACLASSLLAAGGVGLALATSGSLRSQATSTCSKGPADSPESPTRKGVAIVTGGSRGIGAAIAIKLASEGYAVAVNYAANGSAADNVVAQIRQADGVAEKFRADMASEADVVRLFDEVQKTWPDVALTALVNNAGVIGGKKTLGNFDTDEFRMVFDINVLGPVIATREFARRCAPQGGGIVNISSGAASLGVGVYGMSKAALNAMQAWLVKEVAPLGIRMNTVSPGMTRSDMIADLLRSGVDLSAIPMGRIGEPEEIADAVVFLLSEKASYVHGANIRVAGGRAPGTFIG